MPLDSQATLRQNSLSLRDAVLELMARRDADSTMTDSDYRSELRNLVLETRHPVRDLWNKYHNSARASVRARTYMNFGY